MSTEQMSSRERILATMRGQEADRVPIMAGMSQMVPLKRTGRPFWDCYLYGKINQRELIISTMKHFGLDASIYTYPWPTRCTNDPRTNETATISNDGEMIVTRTTCHTPKGDLWWETTYPKYDPPTTTRGMIKNREDFELCLQYSYPPVEAYGDGGIGEAKSLMGEGGVVSGSTGLPGLHCLTDLFDGRLEAATYFCYDHPDLVEQWRQKEETRILHRLEYILSLNPDYIEISASGMLTLSTEELVRSLCLPTLKKVTRLCRQAGIPSEMHTCGRQRSIVEMCVNETELDSINPLQPPPMGDCELDEVKREFGDRITLKGNVGVTYPFLFGKPADVEKDVIRCMQAAKRGGRYILFSEEQLGRDTPEENIHAFVRAGRENGRY